MFYLRNPEAIRMVAALQPGECIEISSRRLAMDIPGYDYNGTFFTPADRVLENIMGSGFEFNYTTNEIKGTVTFCRLKEPLTNGSCSYISPDRRS